MPDRKYVIVIISSEDEIEVWGSLKDCCNNHSEFSYTYLKERRFPFYYKNWGFNKVPFRDKNKLKIAKKC